MKLLLALCLLFAGKAVCSEACLENSFEYVENEEGIYKKIYVELEDFVPTKTGLFLTNDHRLFPLSSLHSDANGIYPFHFKGTQTQTD